MTATTFPTTSHFPHRVAVAAMAALALAGGVTAGITILDDDSDAVSKVPAVVEPIDKDVARLQNSRSLGGAQPVDPKAADKDEIRLQNLQSLDGGSAVQLRFGPA